MAIKVRFTTFQIYIYTFTACVYITRRRTYSLCYSIFRNDEPWTYPWCSSTEKKSSLDITVQDAARVTLFSSWLSSSNCYTPRCMLSIRQVIMTYSTSTSSSSFPSPGILVEANGDVSLQAINVNDKSTDSFLVFPVDTLGLEYFVLCYLFPNQSAFHQGPTQFTVVATSPEMTSLQVVVTDESLLEGFYVRGIRVQGRNIRLNLAQYQTFQV